jgi:hypothetical protein
MNIVVRADGTAELDSRDQDEILLELFEGPAMFIHLRNDQVLEGIAAIDPQATEVNRRARHMVDALVGVHIVFNGTVLLAQLNPEDATELLTIE